MPDLNWWQWALLLIVSVMAIRWVFRRFTRDKSTRTGGVPFSRGIVFAAPDVRPLKPELKPYVQHLIKLHRDTPGFDYETVRRIGREIEAYYGYRGMVDVCDGIRPKLGHGPHKTLERMWNGIGEWEA